MLKHIADTVDKLTADAKRLLKLVCLHYYLPAQKFNEKKTSVAKDFEHNCVHNNVLWPNFKWLV